MNSPPKKVTFPYIGDLPMKVTLHLVPYLTPLLAALKKC